MPNGCGAGPCHWATCLRRLNVWSIRSSREIARLFRAVRPRMSRTTAKIVGPRLYESCEAFGEALIEFIVGPLAQRRGLALQPGAVSWQTPLFSNGLIDSLGILDLIAFVEGAT